MKRQAVGLTENGIIVILVWFKAVVEVRLSFFAWRTIIGWGGCGIGCRSRNRRSVVRWLLGLLGFRSRVRTGAFIASHGEGGVEI